ncbi:MAG: DUF2218 domain-containing protein [Rhodospirillales bacterium]|nr:DUF2218 domain-containing protein [Rhodospirillales bacterium]MDE1883412.1 DUF2218 domain-containing protein [Rhodospirillales bacterium]MDE2391016.1 DUF2218 domain-containing protein [Rhodospirillales bacterium]MDE2458684.1 DUF2218 domain-containing protein [Rhodospirillales bacterium]
MNATAIIPTASARRYLGQFVNHFAHKLPALREPDNTQGEVSFTTGLCTMDADAQKLSIILNAEDEAALIRLKDIVDRHLLRFAFREELQIAWQ